MSFPGTIAVERINKLPSASSAGCSPLTGPFKPEVVFWLSRVWPDGMSSNLLEELSPEVVIVTGDEHLQLQLGIHDNYVSGALLRHAWV